MTPSLDEYLSQARDLNPTYSDAEITAQYHQTYPDAVKPRLDEYLAEAKKLNPDYSDQELSAKYQETYGTPVNRDLGFSGTVVEGAKETGRGLKAFGQLAMGDEAGVVETAQASANAPKDPRLEKLMSDIASRKEAMGQDASWFDVGKSVGQAILDNPVGAGLLVTEQLPNSAVVLGSAGAGAAAGSVLGPAGTILGGLAGLFLGDIAVETGSKAIEAARDRSFGPEEQAQVAKEGVIKGSVIGAVDAATFGMSKWITGAVGRALEKATVSTLTKEGVDVTDKAAVLAARQNPEIATKVLEAQKVARESVTGLGQRVFRASGATGLETIGEGVGEYLGEAAATGKADKTEALIEALAGFGQSAAEVSIAAGVSRSQAKAKEAINGILSAKTTDEVIAKTKVAVDAPGLDLSNIDAFIEKELGEVDSEVVKADVKRDTEAFVSILQGSLGDTVRTDETGRAFYNDQPIKIVHETQLPESTPADGGFDKNKFAVINEIASLFGQRVVVYQDNAAMPEGVTRQSSDPSTIFMNEKAKDTDLFSVFAHEALHLMKGTDFHTALMTTVWEEKTPEARQLAINKHGDLKADALIEEMTSDIAGTELHKPEVWEKVYVALQAKVGDAKAKTEVLGFIEQIKVMISKVKSLITSRPWSVQNKSIAELYVKDLQKVQDSLATGVANAIYQNRASSPGAAADRGKLNLAKMKPGNLAPVFPMKVGEETSVPRTPLAVTPEELLTFEPGTGGFVIAKNQIAAVTAPVAAPLTPAQMTAAAKKGELFRLVNPAEQSDQDKALVKRHGYKGFEGQRKKAVKKNAPKTTSDEKVKKSVPKDKEVLIADLHDAADKAKMPWDDDQKFMDFTERTTGKRHLDDLTQAERKTMLAAIQKTASNPSQPKTAETKEEFDYASTQIDLPAPIAEKVFAIQQQIDPNDLAEKGLEKEPHITVKYGLHDDKSTEVKKLLTDEPPVSATFGKVAFFETEDGDVLHVQVESPDLERLNKLITDSRPNTTTHADYKPHVTIAYVKKGLGKAYTKILENKLKGQSVRMDEIQFSDTFGRKQTIKLKGETTPRQPATVAEGAVEPITAVESAQPTRPSTDIQREILDLEASLEEQGVDTTKLYDPADTAFAGRKGWTPMPEKLAELYRERDKSQPRFSRRQQEVIEKLTASLPETDRAGDTSFLLPDGRRLSTPFARRSFEASNHTALSQHAGVTLQDAIASGAVRYVPHFGVEVGTPLTTKQSEILIDDWFGYNDTLQVDVVGPVGGVLLATKEFDVPNEQIDANGLRNFVSRILDDLQPRFSGRIWFSKLGNTLNEKMPKNASKTQVRNILASGNVKEDEIKWTGIEDFLATQPDIVNKEKLMSWLDANAIVVNEVVKQDYKGEKTRSQLPDMGISEFARDVEKIDRLSTKTHTVYEHPLFPNYRIFVESQSEINPGHFAYTVHKFDGDTDLGVMEVDLETIDAMGEGHRYRTMNRTTEAMFEYLVAEPIRREAAQYAHEAPQTQYSGYKEPGGEDYTELLLTWPQISPTLTRKAYQIRDAYGNVIAQGDEQSAERWRSEGKTVEETDVLDEKAMRRAGNFQSSHFDEPNILAHVRFDTRKDADGKSVLFLEEVQSDWHEQGREKGYVTKHTGAERNLIKAEILKNDRVSRDPDDWNISELKEAGVSEGLREQWYNAFMAKDANRVPDAPFKKSWPELVMKRMLHWAAEHNYDRIAWTTGRMQNERYGLSKHIDQLVVMEQDPGRYLVTALKNGNYVKRLGQQSIADMEGLIGKETTQKVLDKFTKKDFYNKLEGDLGPQIELSGLDLEVGGSGMKYFYDQMLPSFMNKYLKRFGAQVDTAKIQTEPEKSRELITQNPDRFALAPLREITRIPAKTVSVHSVALTQEMKDSVVNQGQPMFARRSSQQATYQISQPTALDKVIRIFQDKHVDLKRIVEDLQKSGRAVPEGLDPVLAEEMYQKRDEQRAKDFTNDELRPLIQLMRLHKVSLKQLDDYAHAKHVIVDNLNARLQAINPDLATSPNWNKLSGITDQEAQAILAGANARVMDQLMVHVTDMVETTRDLMVDYGLESQDRIDEWRQQYQSYVPLHREGFNEEGHPTGKGFSVRGSTVRQRGGSGLAVENILANIAQARDQVVTRGEKMRPVKAMAGLLMLHPNAALATLDKPTSVTYTDPLTGLPVTVPGNLTNYQVPTIRRFDKVSGQMKTYPDPAYKGRDNVVNFRIKGKDYAIVFNEANDRAMEIAKAFKNADVGQLNGIMQVVAPYTRYLAAVNTQYNPIFGIVNFIRDAQFAMLTLSSTPLAGKQAEVLKDAIVSLKGIYDDARNVRKGIQTTSPTGLLWRRFEHVGGPTGYRDLFKTAQDRAEEIERMMDPKSWKGTWNPQKLGKRIEETPMFKWLSDYNQTMENAIRLGVFKAGIDAGMSDLKAASLAKNITVNFNKKGQIGAQMGALYAFFNANVQGTARIAETLFERTPNSKIPFKLSSVGKKIVVGGLLVGVLQTFALAMAGYDDDDPPEFVKQKNLVIPIPGTDKKYAMIPMPLGFNILPNVGRLIAESVANAIRGKPPKVMEKSFALFGALWNTFSPLGGGTGGTIQEYAPTVADPFIAVMENKDWTGKKIAKEDHSSLKPTPGHSRAHDTATAWARAMSYAINWATGGTEYTPGAASPSPDTIDYLIQQLTGGVGREVSKAAQVVQSTVTGEELPLHKIPLAGRFMGSGTGSSAIRSRFFENVRKANIAYSEYEGRALNKEEFSDYVRTHPEARFSKIAVQVQDDVATLQKEKRLMMKRGDSSVAIQAQEMRISGLMARFNQLVEKAQTP